MTMKKHTIEVDYETHKKLHEACPELVAAPPEEKDWQDWTCPSDRKLGTAKGMCGYLEFTSGHPGGSGGLWNRMDLRHLRDHLNTILDN